MRGQTMSSGLRLQGLFMWPTNVIAQLSRFVWSQAFLNRLLTYLLTYKYRQCQIVALLFKYV